MIEADYLFWKPVVENCEFAIKTTSQTESSYNTSAKSVIKQPSYELSSGGRFGIGGYNHDSWDVIFRGTYLYAYADKKVRANSNQFIITPEWFAANNGVNSLKSYNHWRMNFYLLDFAIGREFFVTKRFSAHPYIGIRGAAIYHTNQTNYFSNFAITDAQQNPITVAAPQQFRVEENIKGIGPRIGFDLNFYLSKEWSFLGGLAGSLLYTKYTVREKLKGDSTSMTSGVISLNSIHLKIKEKSNLGRTNLDAYFGLGWSRWFNQGHNRLSLALTFEAEQWFNLNQFFNLDLTNGGGGTSKVVNAKADKNHGDLSIIGGTAHFQIDF